MMRTVDRAAPAGPQFPRGRRFAVSGSLPTFSLRSRHTDMKSVTNQAEGAVQVDKAGLPRRLESRRMVLQARYAVNVVCVRVRITAALNHAAETRHWRSRKQRLWKRGSAPSPSIRHHRHRGHIPSGAGSRRLSPLRLPQVVGQHAFGAAAPAGGAQGRAHQGGPGALPGVLWSMVHKTEEREEIQEGGVRNGGGGAATVTAVKAPAPTSHRGPHPPVNHPHQLISTTTIAARAGRH